MEDCINTIIQEMKDIVQCMMSQIEYELRFFSSDPSISLWTKNVLSKEMWLLCGKKDHNLNLWKPFLAPKAFCDTEPRENKKKIVVYMYIFLRSYTQRVIAIHQTFTECLICFLNYNPIYIYFPINISSKGAMMTFFITIFVTSFTH